MKLSVARSELLDALSVAGKGMSARSTLPILSGILMSASDGKMQLQATDLEISVRRTCAALVEDEGKVVVPGRLLTEIVRNLPEAAVTLETEGDVAHVRCQQSAFTIKTLNAGDFQNSRKWFWTRRLHCPRRLLDRPSRESQDR